MTENPSRTLLLTTHYMTEADELCDRVAIIDGGKVLACDTPASLKKMVQQYPLFALSVSPGPNGVPTLDGVPGVRQATVSNTAEAAELKAVLEEEAVIAAVVQAIVASGGHILSLKKVEATLEDVFIQRVGHGLNVDERRE
jgi:ABC-2 type transport system ATP-binding protein